MKTRILSLFLTMMPAAAYAGGVADTKAGWEKLWHELMIDITVIGVIFAAVTIYFLIKYRRRSPDEEGSGKKFSTIAVLGWALIPAFVFMADDMFLAAKNFELFKDYRNVPQDAYVVEVEGAMWSWGIKYPEGIEAANELRVPVDTPIKVRLTSKDVVHSFFLPYFRNKWDAVPGRETYVWFNPKEVGEYVMTCAEYCGTLHSAMSGKVIVMPKEEFSKWIDETRKGGTI